MYLYIVKSNLEYSSYMGFVHHKNLILNLTAWTDDSHAIPAISYQSPVIGSERVKKQY